MLARMTLLRRPWAWDLMRELGEPDEPPETAEATAERHRGTSLLEQVDLPRKGPDGRPAQVPHFTLHPATRQFIRQRFGDDPSFRLATHLRVGTYLESQIPTATYIETYIEAGHHLFQAAEYDRSYELLGSASAWLLQRGRAREGLGLLEPFLPEDVRRAMRPVLVGSLLGTVGNSYAALGQAEKAVGYYEQDLAIARETGDRRGEGSALGNLGVAYKNLGQAEKAVGYYEQDLAIARETGDRGGEGQALGNLGLAYVALGQAEKAVGYYEQHLAIARETGDRRGEGSALGNLGNAYADLGQAEKAVGYYEQDLAIARETGDRRGEGRALGNLGIAYAALGQAEKAVVLLEQALRIGQEVKNPEIIEKATRKLAQLGGNPGSG
jgi:tetratricopeptide (TPR) repeat protein